MTPRKTPALNLEAATAEAPALRKKGCGWVNSVEGLIG
jgi:hypothetical protein